ncbi:hypothetical protein RclHR1_08060014 [Rhizophagus clarus]|uniref:Uncharacterized protein n=1 Tax=Rhizophagus clarus TaxID=94130 RepID=A0A2Z6RZQ0_9GLOM|nr:hypothetical protein RclHR1_08060014 [Rhizophagus clarus]
MTTRSPARNLKPIIFYNDLFHYVENNNGATEQYALFNIYNLNLSYEELRKEVIRTIGGEDGDDSITVTLFDDFVKPDSPNESSMEGSYIAVGSSIKSVKVKISFKSQKHRDVIEQLRSSQSITDLTHNGFADWVPLDSKSYINIERNSKCDRTGNILNTTKLRTFDEDVDQASLETAINEIRQEEGIESALEILFPGPITTINREINDIVMRVVVFEVRNYFDEEIGKLFIEVLNSLIEDHGLGDSSEAFTAFDILVYRLFTVIRNLIYFNELYGESKIPTWIPFISQPKLREIKDKTHISHVPEENYLLGLAEFTDLDEPLEKLHSLVKRLRGEVEIAQRKINDVIRKWKTPKMASNFLYYGSIASIAIVPMAYFYNNRTASAISSNRLKVSIGCLLSVVLGIWSKRSYTDFHKAIILTRQIYPLLNSTKISVELLEQLLDRITEGGISKINVNNEYKGRKAILKQLFHKYVSVNYIVLI